MSQSDEKRQLRSGTFLTGALVLLALLILMVGSKDRLLKRKVGFRTRFPDAQGLKDGDSVTYLGVRIGAVEEFKILDDGKVEIRYKVDAAAARQFTGTTRATLGMVGVLGDKKIDIMPGKASGPGAPLEPGSEIPFDSRASFEALATGAQDLVTQLQGLATKLGTLLDQIEKGKGTVPRLFTDDAYAKQFLGDLQGATHAARTLLQQMQGGNGALPRLINDPAYGDKLLGDLDGAAHGFRALAERIDKGPGMAHTLVHDPQAGEDLKALVHSLRGTADALSQSKGFLGRLLADPQYGEALAKHLLSSVEHLDSILAKIDDGEGTMGALVNDPSVYNDLRDLSAGLNKSTLGKKAVRHYMKQGHDKRAAPPSAPAAPASAPADAPPPG